MNKQELLKIVDEKIKIMYKELTIEIYKTDQSLYLALGDRISGAEIIRDLINEKWKD